jgi:hypothetical protein
MGKCKLDSSASGEGQLVASCGHSKECYGCIKCRYLISRPIRCTVIFSLEILEKYNLICILILVIYWKKTGLLYTKISNYNIIYSSQKPRKLSSLPLKSSSWLFSLSHDKDVI